MDAGGAETFIMKIYRKIDRTLYQIDFAIASQGKNFYSDEITSLGGKIFSITPKSKSIIRNFQDIWGIVKRDEYKYVLRVSQHSLSGLELVAAKFAGAKICAFRSSNSNTTSRGIRSKFSHYFFRFLPKYFANVKIAPSSEAAIFMFGKRALLKKEVHILKNAIDLDVYKFDVTWRSSIRNNFGIDNCFVVGHVGRFNQQKNHSFLLEIFSEILKTKKNSILLLVGKGELEVNIRQKATKLGILDKIIFTGVRPDIPQLLCAMDVMIFPSLYEGMPNTIIEAQATGLPCYIADTVTREVDIAGLVDFLPLSVPASDWASQVQKNERNSRQSNSREIFIEKSYEINETVKDFINLVFGEKNLLR
jgi:glycosyltransferase involved in cell wall biosynthesis